MKFYLKTLSPEEFMEINQAVTLSGVCTEPTDFSRGEVDVMSALEGLLEVMSENQTISLFALNGSFRGMLEEGKMLQKLSSSLILTLPASEQGFMAAKASRRLQLPVSMGAIFTLSQAAIALETQEGPLLIDMEKVGRFGDSQAILKEILALCSDKTRIIALCESQESFVRAIATGVQAICAPAKVYAENLFNILTESQMTQAREEWIMAYTRNTVLES